MSPVHQRHGCDCRFTLIFLATLFLLQLLIKTTFGDMIFQFQLLNYSNPYFQLQVDGEDYYCVYTFHTWNPRHAVHYKCRLSFTAVIVPDPTNSAPTIVGTKLISVPLNGPLRGIIDFTKALPLDLCTNPLDCNETTWTEPLNFVFKTKPWWVKIIVTHQGALTDSHKRFVAVDQSFVMDQFDINVTGIPAEPWTDDLLDGNDDGEAARVRNRVLMTSLSYRLSVRCAPNYYGAECDLKNCVQLKEKPSGVYMCEKNSLPHYHCTTKRTATCPSSNIEAASTPGNHLKHDMQHHPNVYKLATYVLAFVAALEAFIIFIDVYLRRVRN